MQAAPPGASTGQQSKATTIKQLTVTEARANLHRLIDQAAETSEPIVITGKRARVVLVSQDDWNAIQESLHLLFRSRYG